MQLMKPLNISQQTVTHFTLHFATWLPPTETHTAYTAHTSLPKSKQIRFLIALGSVLPTGQFLIPTRYTLSSKSYLTATYIDNQPNAISLFNSQNHLQLPHNTKTIFVLGCISEVLNTLPPLIPRLKLTYSKQTGTVNSHFFHPTKSPP